MPFYYQFESAPPQIKTNRKRVASNLIALRDYMGKKTSKGHVPPKTTFERLLIATWNIKWFGRYKRLPESLWYIAEILSRFDIIAVQEVNKNMRDLEEVCALMGPWWRFVVTDETLGDQGNDERLAFVYDSRKLRFGGLAGEIVLPPLHDDTADGGPRPERQLARTPFIAGFQCGWFKFMIATVHLYWGPGNRDNATRRREADKLGEVLMNRVADDDAWAPNLILLGDFNIFDPQSGVYKALTKHGFRFPHETMNLPPSNVGKKDRFYDQIGYLFQPGAQVKWKDAGVLDFFEAVYTTQQLATYKTVSRFTGRKKPKKYYLETFRRNEMSDHLLLWTEVAIEFPDNYLKSVAG